MGRERIIAKEAIRTPDQKIQRKIELGRTSIRETILGTASYLTPEQRRRIEAYRRGKYANKPGERNIFGGRAEELLGTEGTIDERIKKYFDEVDKRFGKLGEKYDLQDRKHMGGDFTSIKEEATRLMWVYGITTELFDEDQRGLVLLGVASTNLYLNGKKGETVERERQRMGHAVRMLAQKVSAETTSTKVDVLIARAERKVDAVDDPEHKEKYEKRLDIETQFGSGNEYSSIWEENMDGVDEIIDPVATETFNTTFHDMPHIHALQRRRGLDELPPFNWVVTKLSEEEFENKFQTGEGESAVAFYVNGSCYIPRDTHTKEAGYVQVHEAGHALASLSSTFYLMGASNEADAERGTDNQESYIPQVFVSYYIDDLIDYRLGAIGQRRAETIRWSAAHQKKFDTERNSQEEVTWNKLLIDTFGIEGYLTYALINPGYYGNTIVNSTLLDPMVAGYRMREFADHYADKQNSLSSLYLGQIGSNDMINHIIDMWSSTYGDITAYSYRQFRNLADTLSIEQMQDIYYRCHAYREYIRRSSSRIEAMKRKFGQLIWMKQNYPDIVDAHYVYPSSIFADMGSALTGESIGEDQIGYIQTLAGWMNFDFDVTNPQNSLVTILLRAASGDFLRTIDEQTQQTFAQAVIFAYKRIEAEEREKHNFGHTIVAERVKKEILERVRMRRKITVEQLAGILNGQLQSVG